jgi:hypothetical protein
MVELECEWLCRVEDMGANERRARMLALQRAGRLPKGGICTEFWTRYGEVGIATADATMVEIALEVLGGVAGVGAEVLTRFRIQAEELRRR